MQLVYDLFFTITLFVNYSSKATSSCLGAVSLSLHALIATNGFNM